jgi:Zn-finger protein
MEYQRSKCATFIKTNVFCYCLYALVSEYKAAEMAKDRKEKTPMARSADCMIVHSVADPDDF